MTGAQQVSQGNRLLAPQQGDPYIKTVLWRGRHYAQEKYSLLTLRIHEICKKTLHGISNLGWTLALYGGAVLLFRWNASFFSLGCLVGIFFSEWTREKIAILRMTMQQGLGPIKTHKLGLITILAGAALNYDFSLCVTAFFVGASFGCYVRGEASPSTLPPQNQNLSPAEGHVPALQPFVPAGLYNPQTEAPFPITV